METRCPFLDKQRGEDKPIYKITSNKTINVITVKGILVDIWVPVRYVKRVKVSQKIYVLYTYLRIAYLLR